MSGFENYERELAGLDHEILHYAALCGVDIADHAAIRACIDQPHEDWSHDKARETLRGLLIHILLHRQHLLFKISIILNVAHPLRIKVLT